jgi:TonB family protein
MRALLWGAIVCGCLLGDQLGAQPMTPAAPVRVGGGIKPPVKVRNVLAVYPDLALKARVSGVVILEVHIGIDGAVNDARVLRGLPLLNDAALDAVKQWMYEPTLLNGTPVPVIMTVTVAFTLPDPPAGQPDRIEDVIPWPPAASTAGTTGGVPAAAANPFLVAPERVGLIWVGMTKPGLYRAMPVTQLREIPRHRPRGLTTDVEIALEPGGPTALVANFEDGHVQQIEVRNNRFRTADGFGIGTTLGELRRRDSGLQVVMCDRGPCAVMSSRLYTFELDVPAASAADFAQVPDTATATSVLVGKGAR